MKVGRVIILENENQIEMAKGILERHEIAYHRPGYPDGQVQVIETYGSIINVPPQKKEEKPKAGQPAEKKATASDQYDRMLSYAKSLGYEHLSQAMFNMGGIADFKRRFKKEYLKTE